jgi:hypothetical protein
MTFMDSAPLPFDDRVSCATTQVGMEMTDGVMTTRRLGQVAADWSAERDAGAVLAEVWALVTGSTSAL